LICLLISGISFACFFVSTGIFSIERLQQSSGEESN
jgi:hypothetical protein